MKSLGMKKPKRREKRAFLIKGERGGGRGGGINSNKRSYLSPRDSLEVGWPEGRERMTPRDKEKKLNECWHGGEKLPATSSRARRSFVNPKTKNRGKPPRTASNWKKREEKS